MPDFVESQDTGTSESIRNPFRRDFRHIENRISRPTNFSSSPIIQSTEWGNSHALPKPVADSTPRRRRLRHEDSQIQFVAVDSSPRSPDMESQLLTEHQREVKERQHGNPSVFLEGLRSSSPVLPYPVEDTGVLSPNQFPKIRNTVRDAEAPGTPILANLQDNDDDFPGSSPTPGTKGQVSLHAQKGSALSITSLDVAHSDPPSSPPEMTSSRSPRNKRITRQRSSKRKPGRETQSNIEFDAEESNEGRRSARISASNRTEHSAMETTPSDIHANTLQNEDDSQAQDVLETDSAPMDLIPDTYTDEFEEQIASQLEQDLELAVDLKDGNDSQSAQSSDTNLPSGPVTRKRKRDAEIEEVSTPERTKRLSRKKSKSARLKAAQEESSQSESETSKPPTPQATIQKRGLSTPQSSPLKNHISIDDLSDNTANSGSTRKSRRANREIASSPIKPKSSGSRKRRSLRLSGVTAISPPKSNAMSEPSKNNKKQSQNNNNNAKKNTPVSPEKARKEDDLVQDIEMENGDNEAEQNVESTTDAQVASTSEVMDMAPETTGENAAVEAQNPAAQEGQDIGTDDVMAMEENHTENANAPLVAPDQEKPSPSYVSRGVQTDDPTEDGDSTGGILGSLRRVLSDIKNATFGRGFLREMDDVMFDIRVEAHEATRRSQA
jgi:hypothetical protein